MIHPSNMARKAINTCPLRGGDLNSRLPLILPIYTSAKELKPLLYQ
jgi:hypothetical protein